MADKKELNELRNYYDNTSLATETADAELNTEVEPAPMIGITVRFPQETLDRIRDIASTEGVKTTALIRHWMEERLDQEEHTLRPAACMSPIAFFSQVRFGAKAPVVEAAEKWQGALAVATSLRRV